MPAKRRRDRGSKILRGRGAFLERVELEASLGFHSQSLEQANALEGAVDARGGREAVVTLGRRPFWSTQTPGRRLAVIGRRLIGGHGGPVGGRPLVVASRLPGA